jgi:fatty-acyl-CoA synthase
MTARGLDIPYAIRRAAVAHPGAVAVDDGAVQWTMRETVARAERFANALDRLGVPPGASVGILSENRAEYVAVDLGIALGRRVRVPLNARLHVDDHRYVAADSEMRALVHSTALADAAEALRDEVGLVTICLDDFDALIDDAPPDAVVRAGGVEDPAWLIYTSGTTGRPKGVELSHRSIREVSLNLLVELDTVRPGDVIVLPQPLSHGAGYFVLPYLLSGAGVYVVKAFDAEEIVALAARPSARTLKLVPAMLPPILEAAEGRALDYEQVVYGAAPMPRPVLEAALERLGPVFVQIYGQSEAPVTITCLQKDDHLGDGEHRFSVGRPFRSVAVEVRDEEGGVLPPGEQGEVAVQGSHLMTRYHGLPEATSEVLRDGWILTKDMGRFDERGFLSLVGRKDEIINSGGFNIAPREVEIALCDCPGVEEVAVVGLPDERWGSAVSAAVKLRPGADTTVAALNDFGRARLGFRSPKTIVFVDSIPKTPYGKVDRGRLVELFRPEPSSA